MSRSLTRRRFLQQTTVASLSASIFATHSTSAAFPQKKTEANDRIQIGVIGVGRMGMGHAANFANFGDVQVVAVSDVVKERSVATRMQIEKKYADQTKKGTYSGCKENSDFRKLLADDSIDAVVIATPDHWHAIPCLMAARAGKDIYCEKPLTHNITEGRLLVDAVKKHKVIFQTGSQQRSEFGGRFRRAVELVRNGYIGDVKTIRIGVGDPVVPCDLPTQEIPAGTDWEMWVGPGVKRGYNEVLCPKGVHRHFPQWRRYLEYGGGGLADMGAHHFDIAQWAIGMDHTGPVQIDPPKRGEKSGLKYTYANGIVMYHGGRSGCTFEGTEGTLAVDRGRIESDPKSILDVKIKENEFHVYPSNNHRRNWVDCIRSRKETICPAEIGHRTATVCHLGNIGYRLGRTLEWNPKEEMFEQNPGANAMVNPRPRSPWTYDA